MPTQLSLHAVERSTYIVIASFKDENGTAVVPATIKWSLTDGAGNIINDRAEVEIETPASSVAIVLYGADLELPGVDRKRVVTVKSTYDSATYGDGLPLRDDAEFIIDNLIALPSSSQSPSSSLSPSVSPSTSASPSPSA